MCVCVCVCNLSQSWHGLKTTAATTTKTRRTTTTRPCYGCCCSATIWHRRHTLGLAFVFRIGLAIGFAPLGSDAGLVWCAVLWCGVVRLLGNLAQQLISTPGSTRTCVHGKWLGNNSKRASFAAKEKMHKYCF